MPFKSEKQRRWMWANEPEMAEKWEDEEEKNEERRMSVTKHQLRRIIREEKAKLLKEADFGPDYDPLMELYDIDQNLSDAVMKLQEVANSLEGSDGRRAHQLDGIRGKVEGAKRSVESHIRALEGQPA